MPLKFLKKCRQYNVTSKSLFVISVHHLLDTSNTVDCTISSDSKGQECLDNVCQRLLIQQPEFFGLRYVVKGKEDELKWIDLDRSLSRQLEKYAAGTKIYLRVRHYVTTGVRHLSDEVTRYYYFLQLKSDIFEGKIACDIRTAILLALYCRQAEYDSYQSDKQTKDFLMKSLILPKNLQVDKIVDNILDSLIVEVLQQNAGIQHLTQTQAEEMYIQCCQQLDGYGEERFQAKDTLGNDLLLGLAINGMVVTAENGRQYFPWKDFHTVTIDKRTIKIEQNKADGSIVGSFIFSEADTARYFWKLCITQHKFFKRHIDEDSPSMGGDGESVSMGASADALNATSAAFGIGGGYDFSDSREDLLLEQQQRAIYTPGGGISAAAGGGHTLQQMPHGLMASTTTTNSSALMSSNISLAASHQSGGGGGGGGGNGGIMHAHSGGALGQSWMNKDYTHHDYAASSQHLSQSMHDTRLQSSSCLDLSNNNLHSSSVGVGLHNSSGNANAAAANGSSNNHNNNNNHIHAADAHERERLKSMLPTYRPAPDYETAVQLKYRTPSNNNLHHYQAAVLPAAAYYAGSQPDVHNASVYADLLLSGGVGIGHLAPHHYPDVTQPAAAAYHQLSTGMAPSQIGGGGGVIGGNVYVDLAQRMQIMRSKPPPPYPVNRISSSSTPDLAVASHRPLLGYRAYVSGSSPDLVSNRNFHNSQQQQQQQQLYQYGGAVAAGAASVGAGGGGGHPSVSASAYPYMSMSHGVGVGGHHHSQPSQYPPHGTFENLNMIEEQPSIMSQLRQSALNQAAAAHAAHAASQSYEQNSPTLPPTGYRPSPAQQQQPPSAVSPAPLQRNAMNGSIEPIYENVPLPQYVAPTPATTTTAAAAAAATTTMTSQRSAEHRSSGSSSHANEAMRNRTSSIQSAPGGMHPPPVPAARHHHQQQQQQQHLQPPPPSVVVVAEPDEISMNIKKFGSQTHTDRAASNTELQFLEPTPTPPLRGMRAASAAPAIGGATMTQQHKAAATATANLMKNAAASSSSDAISAYNNNTTPRHASASHDDTATALRQQFGAMNISASTSSMFNSSLDTTAGSAASAGTVKEAKRKKRWNILGRSKTPDKQKSATLGREKSTPASGSSKATKMKVAQDDLNLTHRWSAGVPKLQPISGQFSKEKLCQILDDKLNDPLLFKEFESIPKRRELARYDCALMEENAMKNSDPNFLPYDDNRVRITPTMENRHGYVNASHITATVGTKQRFYIVAQSPHEELTTRMFWQCVWEADVYLIVQLSEDLNYIPPNTNQRLEFGQFQVYQEFSQHTDRCITSKLRLYHIQSRRYRSVWHLNYTDWAEQNCPRDVNHYLDFLEELNSVRMASVNEVPPGHNTNPPVLIHCLEGGGRSGVTLTADLLLYTLDHNEDLDIPRVIGQLRHQRDSIIPSLAQYKFIYSLLITYLKRTRLI